MKTKRFTISIPEPCTENWSDMTPTERGKFCAHCQKDVIDFSTKTDTEIANFVKNNKGNFCGRFVDTQLNKEFSYIEQEKYSNLKYAAALALGLMTAENAVSQDDKPKVEITENKSSKKQDSVVCVNSKNDTTRTDINSVLSKLQNMATGGMVIEYAPKTKVDSTSLKSIQKKEVTKSKKKK